MSSFSDRWRDVLASARARLEDGTPLAGLFVALDEPSLMHLWSRAGADFVILDLEHSTLDLGAAGRLIEAAVNYGVAPLVRAGRSDESLLLRCLDAGAAGVVLPDVRSAQEIDHWVDRLRYPPQGSRGVSSVRVREWGGRGLPDDSEPTPLLVPMIESVEAVQRARELFSCPGVDWWHIGLVDLAMDMRRHPSWQLDDLVRRIEEAAGDTGMRLGVNSDSTTTSPLSTRAPAALATTDRSLVLAGGRNYFDGVA